MYWDENKTGYIHSIETCGTVDGPGIRYVCFLRGCPLRCKYCHNPDTWELKGAIETTVGELAEDIKKYRKFMKYSGGGLTVTGGEPFMQADFVKELFIAMHEEGISTAIDTSGFVAVDIAEEVLEHTDLILLDIKSFNPDVFGELTGMPLEPTLSFFELSAKKSIPVWIRYVLVPGLTDNLDDIKALGDYIRKFRNVQKVEVLPFHKLGEFKWEELGYKYTLSETLPPSEGDIKKAAELLTLY